MQSCYGNISLPLPTLFLTFKVKRREIFEREHISNVSCVCNRSDSYDTGPLGIGMVSVSISIPPPRKQSLGGVHRNHPVRPSHGPCIVTVCVFVRHLFSFYPFYFDFHSARIIFDVSSGFYL